ncbi:nodulation protein D [Novosphingobium sp. Rr 2-17]|uniref:LysR family transcriptional regulator n=1 Tax=Novosphingobium sp. Rr 2-17 TaxID=555793 RepID=UPI000269A58C|nr:LysR family transcriptional regulator [Novosphingobium sp. Rr 2-17]EIZ77204.1 nodulation protein D [Novosphingobium sp. Rr 2-17]
MRLNNLNLNLLIVLDALILERSVSQTATRLHISQPGVSNALARLRAHFEDELLVQVGRSMVLTPFAESIAAAVHETMEGFRRIAAARADFDPATAERFFTFSCSDYVFLVLLTRAIRELAIVAPGLKIAAMLVNHRTPELLAGGTIDFVIAPEQRLLPEHPAARLFSDQFTCIAWTGNTQVGDTLSLEDYVRLEHVSAALGPTNPPHVEEQSLSAQNIVRKIAAYAPEFNSVAEVVVGTDYIGTVHSRAAAILAKRLPLKILEPPIRIEPFAEALQWHKSKDGDPAMTWIRNFLLKLAEDL